MTFQIKGTVGNELLEWPSEGLFAPYTLSPTADIISHGVKEVSTATATEILSIGASSDLASAIFFAFIPSGACRISWRGSGSDADNSAVVLQANAPLVIPGYQTLPYQSTSNNRIDETAAAISSFSCYQSTGATIDVRWFAVG